MLEPGLLGDVGERAVAVVAQQLAFAAIEAQARDVEIDETVVVVIAGGDGEGVDGFVEAGADRDIGESAVAVVVIETAAAVRGSDRDIQIAVVVVIEDRDAAARAGFVQADPRRDIGKLDHRLVVTGRHFHPVVFRDEGRICRPSCGRSTRASSGRARYSGRHPSPRRRGAPRAPVCPRGPSIQRLRAWPWHKTRSPRESSAVPSSDCS